MEIEARKLYKTRNGYKIFIAATTNNGDIFSAVCLIFLTDKDRKLHTWTADGKFHPPSEHPWDIIGPWTEEDEKKTT